MKVVCFGGGNALPMAVLSELRKHAVDITTVASMTDSGGSAGALRKEFNVLPPGDIRRHILGLSEAEEWKKKLWQLRLANDLVFEQGHRGHSFANVFIAGLESFYGPEKALEIAHEFMKVRGQCLPATIDKVNLSARLEDGTVVSSEDEIDVPRGRDPRLRVKEIWIEPRAKAHGKTLEAIEKADMILIGPGDLYSSLAACFLSDGIKESLRKSRATKILVAPAMTKIGETHGFALEDFVGEIEKYMGGSKLDFVVYNSTTLGEERVAAYRKDCPHLEELLLPKTSDKRFMGRDLIPPEGPIEYEAEKVVPAVMELASGKNKVID